LYKIEKLKQKTCTFLFLICSQIIFSQSLRNYSNEFLNLGVDAASFGMGKAVIASSRDVNSVYWNPAGLTRIEDYQGAVMHAEYFQGIGKYDYLAFAKPINDESAFALSVIRFGVDDILNTTDLIDNQGNINYENISLFSAADYAFTMGYARHFPLSGLHAGINGKIVHRAIGDFASSWGFGLDAALQYETQNEWRFGLMLRDIPQPLMPGQLMKKNSKRFRMPYPVPIQKSQKPWNSPSQKHNSAWPKSFLFSGISVC